jgi:hypothetical protein
MLRRFAEARIFVMLPILYSAGVAGIVAGIVAASTADIFPAHRTLLKDWGSGLVVASVALLALAFPMI